MFESNNIMAFVAAILPVFIYSFIVFHLIPKGYVSSGRVKMYLVTGMLSPTLVFMFNFIFPMWMNPVDGDMVFVYMIGAFIQIALLEETTKYITFWWVSSTRKNVNKDLPIATMYYCMMSSAAFAVIENIHYLMSFGDSVLFIRGITAIVLHLVCGLVMGYFIAKSRSAKEIVFEKVKKEGDFGINIHSSRFKRNAYIFLGICASTIIHGVYDFKLSLPFNLYVNIDIYIIIGAGLTISYFMAKEIITMSKDIIEKSK